MPHERPQFLTTASWCAGESTAATTAESATASAAETVAATTATAAAFEHALLLVLVIR
jgi:hypothetical protein